MVRVTVGVEAHTHEFIATAHEDQKFGFSLAGGAAFEAVGAILDEDVLELRGLHSHIGSQIFDTSGFEVAARRVLALQAQIRDEHGVELPELDLGGGFGIAYTTPGRPVAGRPTWPSGCARSSSDECAALRPGRAAAVGRAGPGDRRARPMFTLYEVGTVKDVDGTAHVRQRRRRDERQHPHRAVRRVVLGDAGVARVDGRADAGPRGGKAL